MNPVIVTKAIAGLIVSSGVSKIVKDVVANNVTTDTKLQEALVKVGKYAIGSAVGAVVVTHMNKKIDSGVAVVKKIRERTKEV